LEEERLKRLTEDARRLEPRALAEICEYFYPQIYRFILPRVATQEDAEDLASEVCVRIVEKLPDQRGFLPAWVFRIARNMVTDFHRRRQVRSVVESGYDDETPPPGRGDGQSATPTPLFDSRLERALERLTPEQRDVIRLKFTEGYGTEEIAKILDRSNGAVRALQFRALQSLREFLEPPEGGRQ